MQTFVITQTRSWAEMDATLGALALRYSLISGEQQGAVLPTPPPLPRAAQG